MIPKFRVWEHDVKFMNDQVRITYNPFGGNKIFVEATEGFGWKDVDEKYLMQSTGLHDKNGKEIFEGDIVKALSEGYCGTFQVVWRNEGTPMYILYPAWQNEQFWDLKGVNGVDDGIEVIGNIHEHPELLENI